METIAEVLYTRDIQEDYLVVVRDGDDRTIKVGSRSEFEFDDQELLEQHCAEVIDCAREKILVCVLKKGEPNVDRIEGSNSSVGELEERS